MCIRDRFTWDPEHTIIILILAKDQCLLNVDKFFLCFLVKTTNDPLLENAKRVVTNKEVKITMGLLGLILFFPKRTALLLVSLTIFITKH